jgi:hypothetical protein
MSMISDRSDCLVDPVNDLLPGSTDVEWAERAYRHHPAPDTTQLRRVRGTPRAVWRGFLCVALVCALVIAGVTLLLVSSGTPRPPVRPHVTAHVTTPATGVKELPLPLLRPSPVAFPEIFPPRH